MTGSGWLQIAIFALIVIAVTRPFGGYMTRVFAGEPTILHPLLRPVERLLYRLAGVEETGEQSWRRYALAMLSFSVVGFVTLYALQRLQWYMPFNPQHQTGVEPVLAFNTAVSFVTNTNWQSYVPETTMGYLVQMMGLTVHNFVSAAVGIALALVLIRGFARSGAGGVGNFWVDLTRATLYLLLPIAMIVTPFFVWQGVPQNVNAYVEAATLEGARQTLAQGPVASQEVIKLLGTNGGGFFNANSAHPYENPTALSNLVEMLLLIVIAAGLTNVLGRMIKDERQGWTLFAAMGILLALGVATVYWSEARANPAFAAFNVDAAPGGFQAGGNMEGKEVRFGIASSALFATVTTDAGGAVDAMHDSFLPLGGLVLLVNMALGEVAFGGVGSGLYGMLGFAILTTFIAGTHGRTHARISRQEARGERGQDDHACVSELRAVDPGLDGARRGDAAGSRRGCQHRAARLQRDPLCLRVGDRQQRQLFCRPLDQYALLQRHAVGGDVDGAFRLRDSALGCGGIAGGEAPTGVLHRSGSDAWRAIRGIVGGGDLDHRRPRLSARCGARTRGRGGRDGARNSLSGALNEAQEAPIVV